MDIISALAAEFSLRPQHVENTIKLIDEGNTIPFIARYRKEMTGAIDDQKLRELAERLEYLRNLEEQREKIRAAVSAQNALTEDFDRALNAAATLTELEDLYRPYRPKRKTRASAAKARGLQPLADLIRLQVPVAGGIRKAAAAYLNEEISTPEEALQGAKDIIAEQISDDAQTRKQLRGLILAGGRLVSRAAKKEDRVYAMYYDFQETLTKLAGHRILAINRGERDGFLRVSVTFDKERALRCLYALHVRNSTPSADLVREAAADAYDRLIFPAIERELRNGLRERAEADAIKVFSMNLRHLLLQPPVKGRNTIGLDPGYRTGCKAAIIDSTGKVLDTGVIYPAPPHHKTDEAKRFIKGWICKYHAEILAIGNGTASHETEVFTAALLRELAQEGITGISYMVVSEAGASVYSASKTAKEEFPEFDVSLRSAVSIARRLQDPLAELVKIDPKAIGVGQYQHDMPQGRLSEALDGVVESCVNTVGADLNTASAALLSRIAGINSAVAKNIVAYREANGIFSSRAALKNVPRLGEKVFEQCAGFLRVPESREFLDSTAVHPESYKAAKQLISLCGLSPEQVRKGDTAVLSQKIAAFGMKQLAEVLNIGIPTLTDILEELRRPGRDPRDELPPPLLRTDVLEPEDLKPGMELTGTVRNVIDFGAFVDIGVHQDGLVHISRIADHYIRHPSDVLKVGDIVTVWVTDVDSAKKRISLTMRKPQ